MADLVRFAILHGFKSQGGFAVDLKRPNRWCKDHVLMISSPSARARPGGGWLRDGAVPVADVDSFATFTSGRRKPPSEGLVSNGASSRRPIEIQRVCASAAEGYFHRLPLLSARNRTQNNPRGVLLMEHPEPRNVLVLKERSQPAGEVTSPLPSARARPSGGWLRSG